MSRGRTDQTLNNEWDLLKEEFDNTLYDPQYGDGDINGGVQLDHCRLYVRNIPKALNEEGLYTIFSKFGHLVESHLSKDPLKRYALVRYDTPGAAKLALSKLNGSEPLRFNITIAHKPKKKTDQRPYRENGDRNSVASEKNNSFRDDLSVKSKDVSFKQLEEMTEVFDDPLPPLTEDLDPDTKMKGLQLELQHLQVQEQKVMLRKQLLQLEAAQKKSLNQSNNPSNRSILPDGRIVVQNIKDRNLEPRDVNGSFSAGAGDSSRRKDPCSCRYKTKSHWDQSSSSGSSTPSTCVLCSEESVKPTAKSGTSRYSEIEPDPSSRFEAARSRSSVAVTTDVKSVFSQTESATKSDVTSKKLDLADEARKSSLICDLKCSDFHTDSDDDDDDDAADVTNRLIRLRNSDYTDVDDSLKVVVALAGYPRLKMRLRQMKLFQSCVTDIIDMQMKGGLLKKVPSFLDYYLHRGAIVCICKDVETRNWVVRVSPGLQERMLNNLLFLKPKVKRLCLASMKISPCSWPATALDAFKLLQYFNPTLKTNLWTVYAQNYADDYECTSFLIDKASGEIIRGPTFKNVIDYSQIDFELTGYAEIYHQCLLTDLEEDLCSVASRVKLLGELKSEEPTPRNIPEDIVPKQDLIIEEGTKTRADSLEVIEHEDSDNYFLDENCSNNTYLKRSDRYLQNAVLKKIKDIMYKSENVIVWSDETEKCDSDHDSEAESEEHIIVNDDELQNADVAASDKTESVVESVKNVISRNETEKRDSDHESKAERKENVCDDLLEKVDVGRSDKVESVVESVGNISRNEIERCDSDHESQAEREEHINDDVLENVDVALSDKAESLVESVILRNSNLNIDSNRGIAYHRRTNYLHVEDELKVALTLDGYPQKKLERTHLRRLKYLFKEFLHKDMKMQRFSNLIIPKFHDVYLSNGAVIYICDSLETKDYLTEVLPKLADATGLRLVFRDVKDLVRYTRVVLSLAKEHAHIESVEILHKLQAKYPGLNPDCWKHYSDVAGKQKRQFGVDPESLGVIRSQDFDPIYENERITFRIIDRQKRDVSFEDSSALEDGVDNDSKSQALRDRLVRSMYVPVDPDIANSTLAKIRANHYSNLIPDDLKLYVGPASYPDMKVDDTQFYFIKKILERILCEEFTLEKIDESSLPKFHDMYLFDGVIFLICQSVHAKEWTESVLNVLNERLRLNLKATEFRGAVGIVSMAVECARGTGEVIDALQKQNPRLRTRYWRVINTVRTGTKLDVTLQIDKLSAQVITSPDFKSYIDGNAVVFKLGHLKSLLKPKCSLEALTKRRSKRVVDLQTTKCDEVKTIEQLRFDLNRQYPALKIDQWDVTKRYDAVKDCKDNIDESSRIIGTVENKDYDTIEDVTKSCQGGDRIVLKIPLKLIPDNREELNMLLGLLKEKNPGLNTGLWHVVSDCVYPNRFSLVVDKRSAVVIKSGQFDPVIAGEELKFLFA